MYEWCTLFTLRFKLCVSEFGKYISQCPIGFSGFNCEVDVDECSSSPCQNGATCHDSSSIKKTTNLNNIIVAPHSYICTCVAGYSGYNCQTDIDECKSAPCLHGATCTQAVAAYACTCAAGYADVPVGTCYSELDECSSAPCLNAGTCFDHMYAYTCVCAD